MAGSIAVITLVLWFCLSKPAAAVEEEFTSNRLFLGLGATLVRLDSNFKFTDKEDGSSVFIDAEGTLNLPDSETVPTFYGYYRFADKHGIGWQYFKLKREGTLVDDQVNLGDLTFTGRATLTDRSTFSFLSYNYTLFEKNQAVIFGSLGLYALDLNYEFRAEGELSIQGVPVAASTFTDEESVFAPLPLLGIDALFTLTPKWAFGTKVSLVAGSYQDVSAGILDTRIRARYRLGRHAALLFGISYFDADVTIDGDDTKTEIAYGFDGGFIGLDLGF